MGGKPDIVAPICRRGWNPSRSRRRISTSGSNSSREPFDLDREAEIEHGLKASPGRRSADLDPRRAGPDRHCRGTAALHRQTTVPAVPSRAPPSGFAVTASRSTSGGSGESAVHSRSLAVSAELFQGRAVRLVVQIPSIRTSTTPCNRSETAAEALSRGPAVSTETLAPPASAVAADCKHFRYVRWSSPRSRNSPEPRPGALSAAAYGWSPSEGASALAPFARSIAPAPRSSAGSHRGRDNVAVFLRAPELLDSRTSGFASA